MRIVIEFDHPGSAPIRPEVHVEGPLPPAAPDSRLEATPVADVTDALHLSAGTADPLAVTTPSSEPPPEVLARAARVNALDAGPAPGFVTARTTRSAITAADSPSLTAAAADTPPGYNPVGLPTPVVDGGLTNAGPAPR